MTAPPLVPFEADIRRGLDQIQEALAQAPGAAREETKQVLNSEELVKRVVNIMVPVMDTRFRKKYYRNMIFGVGVLLAIFAVAMLAAFQQISDVARTNAATNTDQDAALQRTQNTIAAFQQQLSDANSRLVAQGLPPIQGPTDPQPGSAAQAQLINAAATASTLAALPQQALSPADVATAVADYLRANPPSVDSGLVIRSVADYLAANQDALRGPAGAQGQLGLPGEQGPAGPEGPPPTAEQIQAAFRDEVQANPQLLCPLGGDYGARQISLANGGSVTQFGCFGGASAPPDDDPPPAVADSGASEDQPGNSGGGDAAVPPPSTGGTITPDEDTDEVPPAEPEPTAEAPAPLPAPELPSEVPEAPGDLLGDLLGVGDKLLGAG